MTTFYTTMAVLFIALAILVVVMIVATAKMRLFSPALAALLALTLITVIATACLMLWMSMGGR